MEASICGSNECSMAHPFHQQTPHQLNASTIPFRSVSVRFKNNHGSSIRFSKERRELASGCAQRVPEADLETELEGEMGEEWMTQMKEKCKERKGVVELLECLEKEAIMGEDEGRNPLDYNRRALIFDTSSRVFQALRNRTATHQP